MGEVILLLDYYVTFFVVFVSIYFLLLWVLAYIEVNILNLSASTIIKTSKIISPLIILVAVVLSVETLKIIL